MQTYRRNRVPGGTYFFTVTLFDRESDLLVREIAALREAVRRVRVRTPFHIDAWVVLPNHMHCLWTLPEDDIDYAGRWRAIKKAFFQNQSIPPSTGHRCAGNGMSAGFGNGGFGNTPCATNRITPRIWITSISIW